MVLPTKVPLTKTESASFIAPVASRVVAPELMRWMNPFAAPPSGFLPVTRSTASGLQYVRTSLNIAALPVTRCRKSIERPFIASFSVAIFFGTAEGLQPLFGRCYGAKNEADLKCYLRAGMIINFVGSVLIYILLLFVGKPICTMFGADPETLGYTVASMPKYAWGFSVMALNTIISAYLYSTKRSTQAIIMNVLRSFVFDIAVIILLPEIFGAEIIWHTFGIFEAMVLAVAIVLLKSSEKNGVVFK